MAEKKQREMGRGSTFRDALFLLFTWYPGREKAARRTFPGKEQRGRDEPRSDRTMTRILVDAHVQQVDRHPHHRGDGFFPAGGLRAMLSRHEVEDSTSQLNRVARRECRGSTAECHNHMVTNPVDPHPVEAPASARCRRRITCCQ